MNPPSRLYEASLFHPDFGADPVAGTVLIRPVALLFQSEALSVEIPTENLEVEFESDGNGIFLNDAERPDVIIFTRDQAILRNATIRTRPQVAAALSRRELTRALRLTGYFIGACVVVVWLGSLATSAMVRAIAARVPMRWEQKIGDHEIQSLQKRKILMEDTNDVAQLAALCAPLIQVLPPDRRALTFYVADEPLPNAFALPGGHVVVTSGLLQMTDQPDEILGVLAHELAHQTKRHVIRRGIAAAGPLMVFGLFLHSNSGAENILAIGSGLMVFQGFSRDYETEADDVGWNYMVAANIDPRGMIHAFQKLEAAEVQFQLRDGMPESLQSHPATAKRIARLEKKWDKLSRKSDFIALPTVKWTVKDKPAAR